MKHIEKVKPKFHFPVVATSENAVVTEEVVTTKTVEVKGIKIYVHCTTRVVKVVIYHGNVIRPICGILLGKHHPFMYRMFAGVGVAAVGLFVAKYFGHSHNDFVAYAGDGIGFGLHALGCVPFIDKAIEHYEKS